MTRLGAELRDALVEASMVSLSTMLPPNLLEQLVKRDPGWDAWRAFDYIERMADDRWQAQGLARIAWALPEESLGPALVVAKRCRAEEDRAACLQALIPRMRGNLLEFAADAVLDITDNDFFLPAMVATADRLPCKLLHQLLLRDASRLWGVRSVCLQSAIAFFCSDGSQAARTALALTGRVENEYERGLLAAALLPYLPGDAFDEVLAVLGTIPPRCRNAPLIVLAEHVPSERVGDLLEFLTSGPEFDPIGRGALFWPGAEFFRQLAKHLASEHLQAALHLCRAGPSGRDKAESFAALAPLLDARQACEYLATSQGDGRPIIVRELFTPYSHELGLIVVAALLDRLPEQEACDRVSKQIVPHLLAHDGRSELPLLGRFLTGDQRRTALADVCQRLKGSWGYASFLARFASFTDEEIAEVFDAAQSNSQFEARLMVADVLAPYLSENQLEYALTRVIASPLEEECFAALAELGRYQPPEDRARTCRLGLELAKGITHIRSKTCAVAALAPIITGPLANDAFKILRWSGDTYLAVRAMEAMADVLPVEQLRTVPEWIRGSGYPDPALDIPKILKRLSNEGYATVIDGLVPRREGSWDSLGSERIIALVPVLSPSQARRAWHIAEPGDFSDSDTVALSALAGRLPERERAAAVDEVLAAWLPTTFHSDVPEAQILGRLARAASTDRLTQALREYLVFRAVLSEHLEEGWRRSA